jgi:uncharacterized membrane protein
MIGMGVLHLAHPEPFVAAVPGYLPYPFALVILSGICEIAGGVGLLIPFTQSLAAWGLIALFVAVFPANLNMALHPQQWPKIPAITLWLRLPFQVLLIAWAKAFTGSIKSGGLRYPHERPSDTTPSSSDAP